MVINKIRLDEIRSNADRGIATTEDATELLEYIDSNIDSNVESADFQDQVLATIEQTLENKTRDIGNAVQLAILKLKK